MDHLVSIHLAKSPEMRDLLMKEIGDKWDTWGHQMDVFWNSNCQPPWDNWSMGLTDTPNSGPNNNPHEAWHRDLNRGRIPNMLRGSTEHVFEEALPQLIELDGLFKPTQLTFDVPAVPKGVMKKALWYVNNQDTHVHAFKSELGVVSFYVLQKDNEFGAKKISERLMQMWEAAKEGKKDHRIKDLHGATHSARIPYALSQHGALFDQCTVCGTGPGVSARVVRGSAPCVHA